MSNKHTVNQIRIRRDPKLVHTVLIFFLCLLKLLITTPMKRFNMKKDPKIIKITKKKYMGKNASKLGCSSIC